jgi:hypothetical protein
MRHLLLQFAENPTGENIDLSIVAYDHNLNLNVVKGTTIPAVTFSDQETQTFTKANGEGLDSDSSLRYQQITSLTETTTSTRANIESADSDPHNHILSTLLDTSTSTFVHSETSESDKNFKDLAFLSATQTLTETVETADSDKK